MPDWCPNCKGMLPEGLEECPRCGQKLRNKKKDDSLLDGRDIFNITLTVVGIALIPLTIVIVIALLCTFAGNAPLLF